MNRRLKAQYDRPPFLGPIFIIALILAGWVLWRQYGGQPVQLPSQAHQLLSQRPRIERRVLPPQITDKIPPPDFVLRSVDGMGLSAKSKQALEDLSRKSAQQLEPLKEQAERKRIEFSQYMNERQAAGRTPSAEIQKQMDQVQVAMLKAEEATRQFWQNALQYMSADQKAKLERKWQDEKKSKQATSKDKKQ